MTFDELLMIAPRVINELATEFVRRGDECLKADKTSQFTACMFLALRSVSLLCGMVPLLQPARRDSCDVLGRSLLESTDLLMHFRFRVTWRPDSSGDPPSPKTDAGKLSLVQNS